MSLPLIISGTSGLNADLYNRALSSAYQMWYRLYDPDYALSRDPDIWNKVRRDSVCAQCIDTRLHMVAGKEWNLEAATDSEADKEAASVCEDIIRHIKNFTEARYLLAMALFRSRSYAFIEGKPETRTWGDGKPRTWWVPYRLRDLDRRRIRFRSIQNYDKQGQESLRVVTELWSVLREQYEELEDPSQFVKMTYRDEESRLSYGRGLLDSMYFYVWARGIIWREGLTGLERWSQGILIGKVDSMREGSTGKTNETMRNELFDSLKEMRSRHVLVTDKETELQVVTGGMEGHSMCMDFLKYLDEKLTSLILGSSLPFGGGDGGGSYARAEVEQGTTHAMVQFDRDKIDEALTEDLVGLVWAANFRNLASIGLEGAGMPRFRSHAEKREDPQQAAGVIAQLAGIGLPLKLEEVYRKTGFTMPSEDDEVFEAPQQEAPQEGGFPFKLEESING